MGVSGRVVLRDPCADVELRAHQGRGVRASHVPVVGGGGDGRGDWADGWRANGLSVAGRFPLRAAQVMGGSLVMFTGVALGILTFERNVDYQSDLSIWEDTVAKAPGNARAHNNLGNALSGCGRARRGHRALSKKRWKSSPTTSRPYNNLGVGPAQRGTDRRGHRPLPEGGGSQATRPG